MGAYLANKGPPGQSYVQDFCVQPALFPLQLRGVAVAPSHLRRVPLIRLGGGLLRGLEPRAQPHRGMVQGFDVRDSV